MDVKFDFEPYFKRYQALTVAADAIFERVRQQYPNEVKCAPVCSDCCHALFDLTLVEALYVNHQFHRKFTAEKSEALLEQANKADRVIASLKRKAYKALEEGRDETDILTDLARERVRCPLLNGEKMCELYDHRPITCRLYGVPTAIGGKSHTCGLSGFKEGEAYPTVDLDKLHAKLQEISADLVLHLKSKYVKLADLLIPLPMALLTDYDEAYLGVGDSDSNSDAKENKSDG